MTIYVNIRSLSSPITGVQRYTLSLLKFMNGKLVRVEPGKTHSAFPGHLWEQVVLPIRVGDNRLWSPANTGPLSHRNQIVTIHDAATLDHPEWFSPLFARWYKSLIPRLIRQSRGIITVSEFSKQRLIEWGRVPQDHITVTYPGVDEKFTPVSDAQLCGLRMRLNLPERYVLYVGSLEPRKNLYRMLAAWNNLSEIERDGVMLLVAGSAGKVFRTQGVVNDHHDVRFLGRVNDKDLPGLYSGAIAFVYPSLYEGFGLPVLEAMSCGTPTITSNVTALSEVFQSTSLTMDPFDIESMSHALYQVINSSSIRERLSMLGLQESRRYNWKNTAAKTLEILRG